VEIRLGDPLTYNGKEQTQKAEVIVTVYGEGYSKL